RLKALDDDLLMSAYRSDDRVVRVHAMRIMAERHEKPSLGDPDPMVRRAAADALGVQVDSHNIAPLLKGRQLASPDDPQLVYTIRMALRNQLLDPSAWQHLPNPLSESDARALADVAPGVHSPEAADFMLRHLQKYSEGLENRVRYIRD